jgi:PAS domain S-box-containing protein
MVINKDKIVRKVLNVDDLFRIMADCAPVLLWVSRADSSCVFFNKSWLEFTGKSVDEEWGVGWTEGIHFEDFQKCMDTYVEHFNSRTPFEMEYRLRRFDGEYRWILDKGVPYYQQEGNFLGFIGSCIDITENKEAAELLVQMNEQLEQRVQERTFELRESEEALAKEKLKAEEATLMKSQFVSTLSHELRTPMTVIKGSLELLLHSKAVESPEQNTLIHIAYDNTKRLLRLVNDILDVEKIAAGKLSLNLKEQPLLPILQKAIISNRLFAKQYNVHLQLVEGVTDARAQVDEDRFLQVLDNLLSNAAKFSYADTTVYIAMTVQHNKIRIAVMDSGGGIPLEFKQKIFSQFVQAHSAVGSSGLGLNIAKSIMEQHQGTISFETSSSGTTFYIDLPAC